LCRKHLHQKLTKFSPSFQMINKSHYQ